MCRLVIDYVLYVCGSKASIDLPHSVFHYLVALDKTLRFLPEVGTEGSTTSA